MFHHEFWKSHLFWVQKGYSLRSRRLSRSSDRAQYLLPLLLRTSALHTQVDSIRGRPKLRSASIGCIQIPSAQTSVAQWSFAYNGLAVTVTLPYSSVSLMHIQAATEIVPMCGMSTIRRFCCVFSSLTRLYI